jgi:hypothetical protein
LAVPANVAEEAIRTVKLLERAVSRISEFEFPRLTVNVPETDDDDEYRDDEYTTFTCPWGGHDIDETDIVAVESGERDTGAQELEDMEQTTLYFDYGNGGDDNWSTLYHKCGVCDKPVSLPVGYDTDSY